MTKCKWCGEEITRNYYDKPQLPGPVLGRAASGHWIMRNHAEAWYHVHNEANECVLPPVAIAQEGQQ